MLLKLRFLCLLTFILFLDIHLAFAQRSLALRPVPAYALTAQQLAVVINDEDVNSVAVGEYYMKARNIPAENLIHISLKNPPTKLNAKEFQYLRQNILQQLKPHIQALLLVWSAPYAVECNSITSAMAFGFDGALCKKTCAPSKPNPYFNSTSITPYTDFGIRPVMLMPADSIESAQALIGRGLEAGKEILEGSAYFLITGDRARNSRAIFFPPSVNFPQKKLHIKTLRKEFLEGVTDIMLYQTGAPKVAKLDTLHFLPGALADHLTSLGGDLAGKNQMSSEEWLKAGATASYGSVSEPCNYWQKFPHPTVLLKHYLAGASALEAYLKSVAWPAQGLIIGEPLATPYPR